MSSSIDLAVLIAGVLMLASVVLSKFGTRFGVPSMLLFMFVGMALGADGLGAVEFADYEATYAFGAVALALILFSGGMDMPLREIRPVLAPGLVLSTLGVVATAALMAVSIRFVLGLSWRESMLLGSIVASTDAAAVFALIRERETRIPERVRQLAEFESGTNDPTAVFLAVTLAGAALAGGELPFTDAVGSFVWQMTVGGVIGAGLGWLFAHSVRRLRLGARGMYAVLSVSLVCLSFGASNLVGGNGFLAAYLAGLLFATAEFREARGLAKFHDNVAWLMQVGLFLVLGLLVAPSELPGVAGAGVSLALLLIFVVRPTVCAAFLLPFGFRAREAMLVSWCGMRGAVPIVLATIPMTFGLPNAATLFNVAFFVVIVSAAIQGALLTSALGILGPKPVPEAEPSA